MRILVSLCFFIGTSALGETFPELDLSGVKSVKAVSPSLSIINGKTIPQKTFFSEERPETIYKELKKRLGKTFVSFMTRFGTANVINIFEVKATDDCPGPRCEDANLEKLFTDVVSGGYSISLMPAAPNFVVGTLSRTRDLKALIDDNVLHKTRQSMIGPLSFQLLSDSTFFVRHIQVQSRVFEGTASLRETKTAYEGSLKKDGLKPLKAFTTEAKGEPIAALWQSEAMVVNAILSHDPTTRKTYLTENRSSPIAKEIKPSQTLASKALRNSEP